jgi:hypothetical protein
VKLPQLIFVYAGDSGTINTLIHIAHKIISPKTYPCNLCGLIYNIVTEKKEWTHFMKNMQRPSKFLHRDEFVKKHPEMNSMLPAVFTENGGVLTPLVEASEINRCKTTSELIRLIEIKVADARVQVAQPI